MSEAPITALLIEDNFGDARLICEMLRDSTEGTIEVVHADRLSAGLARLAEEGIDVVLTDLALPDSTGLDTFLRVRDQAPSLPIIVLSGLSDVKIAVKAVTEGAQDYLVKSQVVSESLLVRAIRYAIERKRVDEMLKKHSQRLEEMVAERTQELAIAQEQMIRQARLVVLGQLAGSVGHDLRNPLGAISNSAYYLKLALPKSTPEIDEALAILDREVRACNRIISSLLDFARVKKPMRARLDLNALIVSALVNAAVPERVQVEYELDAGLPDVWADADQLARVFENLVINAVQAMPQAGVLTIRTGLDALPPAPDHAAEAQGERLDHPQQSAIREKTPALRIAFCDTGSGIAPENLNRIFEPLFTTKTKGIGLGLALIKTLVEGHGGSIEVASALGKGSVFTVRLPLVA